nr:UvrD-helicase domain-containing protein [Clostridia bacterium]
MYIADFHIHSKYARATSTHCVPEHLAFWACRKGLQLIGTGDFTHPAWRAELREKLVPAEEGLYALREELRLPDACLGETGAAPRFVVSGEISSIYKKNGKVRKVHNVILLPSLEDAERLSHRLEQVGNLHSDGRPILGLDSRDLLEITLEACAQALFIPAHIWTPHFSLFGAYSGFDDIAECFEDLTPHIFALETGLSSDPPMNWRISALDPYTLVSNSDAHSPGNLAREANLFNAPLSYPGVVEALRDRQGTGFAGTLEFFPEEGKYHCDGHRPCKVCLTPAQTRAANGVCPACGGRITVGVLHRVEVLADRPEGFVPPNARAYERLIPLLEILASALGHTAAHKRVGQAYEALLSNLGSELHILRQAPLEDVEREAGPLVAEGIRRLRAGQVALQPGYDGEYGRVSVLTSQERALYSGQLSLLPNADHPAKRAQAAEAPAQQPAKASAEAKASPKLQLNAAQREAVVAAESVVAVIAGPGAGKTRTLVERIAHLVGERGAAPGEITAVTFTNKAAGEMRARLETHFGDAGLTRQLTIGTFHALCLKLLKASGNLSSLLPEAEALALVADLAQELRLPQSPR